MTNWPTSWKVIFGDHTTQQIILRVVFGDRARFPRKKHGKSIFGNFWDRRMGALFIHISESINLNMRSGTALEKPLASNSSWICWIDSENFRVASRLTDVVGGDVTRTQRHRHRLIRRNLSESHIIIEAGVDDHSCAPFADIELRLKLSCCV